MNTALYESPLGTYVMGEENGALVGLWLMGQKYFPKELPPVGSGEGEIFARTRRWLDAYFAGGRPEPGELRLAPRGSGFARQVWGLLLEIPYGQTVTYGQLAKELAQRRGLERMSAQAVGGAVGHNPISIIIPCHRVLGGKGQLTGYAGGLEIKRRLLELEGVELALKNQKTD